MRPGEHEWPEEFKDEDKWFFLTKRQWLIIAVGVLIDFLFISFILMIGLGALLPILLIPAAMLLIAFLVVAFLDMPSHWYLFGAGFKIEKILLRLILKRRKSQKKIYTKHYDNKFREW